MIYRTLTMTSALALLATPALAQEMNFNRIASFMVAENLPDAEETSAEIIAATADGMTLVCGRFEGLDQRVIDHYDLEEISIGDYVLTGGELAAQVLLDATVRLIPGVLGNAESTQEESFQNDLLEHPQYTKPASWRGHDIPPVLLSGDHGAVAKWRKAQAEALTQARRPDLWAKHQDNKA
jgi:tRNA (guanine37-N1)-methyltransferase